MVALGLLALTIAGFLVVLDRRDKRQHEDRQAQRLEIAGLLQRIQAPQLAVAQHQAQDARDLPAVNPFDHVDYWDAQNAALERMAAIEREGLT